MQKNFSVAFILILASFLSPLAIQAQQEIEIKSTLLVALVTPQVKLEAPSNIIFEADTMEQKISIYAHHIVTPNESCKVTIFIRAQLFATDGQITWIGTWQKAFGETGQLSTAWQSIALGMADVANFSGEIKFKLTGTTKPSIIPLEWKYNIMCN